MAKKRGRENEACGNMRNLLIDRRENPDSCEVKCRYKTGSDIEHRWLIEIENVRIASHYLDL